MKMIKLKHPTIKSEPHTVGRTIYDVDAHGCVLVPEDAARMMEAGKWVRIGIVDSGDNGKTKRIMPRSIHELKQLIVNMGMRAKDIFDLANEMWRDEGGVPEEASVPVEESVPMVETRDDFDPFGFGEQEQPVLGIPRLITQSPDGIVQENIKIEKDEPVRKSKDVEKIEQEEIDIDEKTPIVQLRRVARQLGLKYLKKTTAVQLYEMIRSSQEQINEQ